MRAVSKGCEINIWRHGLLSQQVHTSTQSEIVGLLREIV